MNNPRNQDFDVHLHIDLLLGQEEVHTCKPCFHILGDSPDTDSQVDSEDPHQRRQRKGRHCFGGIHTDSRELGRAYLLKEPDYSSDDHSLNCLNPSEPRGLETPELGHVGGAFGSPPVH